MRGWLSVLSLSLTMASLIPCGAQAPPAPAPGATQAAVVLIKAGRLVDGRTATVQTNVGILVDGERIKAVGPLAQVQAQAGTARVIDLSQMTVLPGMIDAHTHLLLQGDVTAQEYEDQLLKQSDPVSRHPRAADARLSLEHGFTAIRDVETEGAMYADVDVKLAINRGEIPGPRVFASTRAMAPTGMYPIGTANWEIELPHGVQVVDGSDNARLAVREQVQHGADWIKYYSDRRYYFTPDSVLHSWVNFTDAEAKAIVDEAHRLGRGVAAHAIGSDGIAAALRVGVNSVEHGDGLTDSLMDVMVKNNVYWVPTVTVGVHVMPRGGVWPTLVAPSGARSDARCARA
jgi:imidazolonepropionase-like amidohydrolase